MECSPKKDVFGPPEFGVRLLEIILPPEVAQYEIGDLEEEYRTKAKQEGTTLARRWFWLQVFITLKISVTEDGVWHLILGRAVRWYQKRVGSSSVLLDADQVVRHPVFILAGTFLLAFLCILILSSLGFFTTPLRQEVAQRRDAAPTSRIEELPNSVSLLEEKHADINTRQPIAKSVPTATRRTLGVPVTANLPPANLAALPKKTAWIPPDKLERLRSMILAGGKISLEFTNIPVRDAVAKLSFLTVLPFHVKDGNADQLLTIALREVTLTETVAIISSQTGVKIEIGNHPTPKLPAVPVRNTQDSKERSSIVEGSIETVIAKTPPRTDIASVPRDRDAGVSFIERKEREYLSAPSAVSKPSQQTQSQAVPIRGCFF